MYLQPGQGSMHYQRVLYMCICVKESTSAVSNVIIVTYIYMFFLLYSYNALSRRIYYCLYIHKSIILLSPTKCHFADNDLKVYVNRCRSFWNALFLSLLFFSFFIYIISSYSYTYHTYMHL